MKKILITLFSLVVLTACSNKRTYRLLDPKNGKDGKDGTSCILQGTVLDCGGVLLDLVAVNGSDGKDGLNGADGADGTDGIDGSHI